MDDFPYGHWLTGSHQDAIRAGDKLVSSFRSLGVEFHDYHIDSDDGVWDSDKLRINLGRLEPRQVESFTEVLNHAADQISLGQATSTDRTLGDPHEPEMVQASFTGALGRFQIQFLGMEIAYGTEYADPGFQMGYVYPPDAEKYSRLINSAIGRLHQNT